jgi:hypothetical protein
MNAIEDRLRAVMQAVAVIVPDGSAPPLIPPEEKAGPAVRRRSPRRNVTWIAPLTATAAVIALVAGLIAVHGSSGGHQAPTGFAAPAARLPDGLPAYILAAPDRPAPASDVTFQYRPSTVGRETIDIIATATGRTAQTATLPGLVVYVTADAQGRFYAAVLMRSGPVRLYEIRRRASGTVAAVTVLPIRATRAMIGSLAVSPNGRRLAMTTYRANDQGDPGTPRTASLVVSSTASGAERRWTPARVAEHGTMNAMTWLADNQTLALAWWPTDGMPAMSASLRLLDTAAPGTGLLAGRAVLKLINPAGKFPALAISQTGRVLVGATFHYPGGVVQGQRVATGSLIRFFEPGGRASFLYRPPDHGRAVPGDCQPPAWISPSGRQVLTLCARVTKQAAIQLVLLSEGRATVLPQLARLAQHVDLIALSG